MKNSRTSLNKPFYDWIKEVREANEKIEELEDKLYYYNVKLIDYNSPNFEPRLSSTKPEHKDNRYIWIDKIFLITKEINKLKELKKQFMEFRNSLLDVEKAILENYINFRISNINYSRSYYYKTIDLISRKFTLKFAKN